MENKTKFYRILLKAQYDKEALMIAINQVMPLINKYSVVNGKFDEDLKSYLIEYVIKTIKNKNFLRKFQKNNK